MILLHNLSKLIGDLTGHGSEPTRQLSSPPKAAVNHPAATPQQTQNNNAGFAAEGAEMYEQAHPGQKYVMGQNGETYDGGVNMNLYSQLLATHHLLNTAALLHHIANPAPAIAGNMPAPAGNPQQATHILIAAPDIQGEQNPGQIPLQSSQGFGYTRNLQPAYIRGYGVDNG